MRIQAVRGTHDVLPDEVAAWHRVEDAARALFARYGYRELRTPIFEQTELFGPEEPLGLLAGQGDQREDQADRQQECSHGWGKNIAGAALLGRKSEVKSQK